MAKIPQGILGGIKGKIGGIIGTSWKGINVIKTAPLSVANPQTAGQVAQRTKFGNVVAFAVLILSVVIKPLWDRFASKQSGFNAFIQSNVSLFAAEMPVFGTGFIISKGKMASTSISSLVADAGASEVGLEWVDDSGSGYKLATDIPYAVVINHTQGTVNSYESLSNRENEEINIPLDSALVAGDVIDAYLAFKRADGTIVSNTSSETGVSA